MLKSESNQVLSKMMSKRYPSNMNIIFLCKLAPCEQITKMPLIETGAVNKGLVSNKDN